LSPGTCKSKKCKKKIVKNIYFFSEIGERQMQTCVAENWQVSECITRD